jgi:glycosyltransferase involved in cell wall biosynthesis
MTISSTAEKILLGHSLDIGKRTIADLQIAVLIPCYNEASSIGKVVGDFAAALPTARIYVYDNNSRDETIAEACRAGAIVRREAQQGKGHVVRRMFSDIGADIYVLVDGDDTYEAAAAPQLVQLLVTEGLDMVNGCRVAAPDKAYRPGHRMGNRLFTGMVSAIFGKRTKDMLSGYRVFSHRFVKSFPALSRGFEIETELTVHALELRMPIADVDTVYGERGEGSQSKLNTFRDGLRISWMIALLVKEERPLQFFTCVSVALGLLSVVLAWPLAVEFHKTGLVPRLPTAVLSAAIMIVAVLSLFAGLILDTVTHGRQEVKRLVYLSFESPAARPRPSSLDASAL